MRHRASVVDDIVDELGEESKRYAVAFDALNDFVDAALDVVLAQLVCYGLPEAPADLFDLALEPGDPPTARFALNLDTHTLHCDLGELLFVSSDLITEVVVCSALEMSDFGQGRQPRFVVSGQLLEGAAAGWSLT